MAAQKNNYRVAIYCRLSKDDGSSDESASIATQRAILTDYVRSHGWQIADIYVDDGYSGTNFNRPDFQRMIEDIENRKIDCVITKDLSRLGRNYLDCGIYLEIFFPEHNVRYISVNDGVDTQEKSAMDITPFRNILNEMYSADISVKVKSALRSRLNRGLFHGSHAPYGYAKDPQDKNHLVVDPEAAEVVKQMFALALEGKGTKQIRDYLRKHKVLRPSAYAVLHGESGYDRYCEVESDDELYQWSMNSVRAILINPIYVGHLVGYKRVRPSMKSKRTVSKAQSDWVVVENTHEGIIPQEDFDVVQRLIESRKSDTDTGYDNIFAGIVKCADCGHALTPMSANRRKRFDPIDCVVYSCNQYRSEGADTCTAHVIEARDLQNIVLSYINKYVSLAIDDSRNVEQIRQQVGSDFQSSRQQTEKELRKAEKRLAELDKLYASLYEDKVQGLISERNFRIMNAKYDGEQTELEEKIAAMQEVINSEANRDSCVHSFLQLVKQFSGLTKLTARTVNTLIDRIEVSEKDTDENGNITQRIKIFFKFVGCLEDVSYAPVKLPIEYAPKPCACCGKTYTPGGNVSKYCDTCRIEIRRQKQREAGQRRTQRRAEERERTGTGGFQPITCKLCGETFKPNSGHSSFCPACKETYKNPSYQLRKRATLSSAQLSPV